jgi:hypothetical protein
MLCITIGILLACFDLTKICFPLQLIGNTKRVLWNISESPLLVTFWLVLQGSNIHGQPHVRCLEHRGSTAERDEESPRGKKKLRKKEEEKKEQPK